MKQCTITILVAIIIGAVCDIAAPQSVASAKLAAIDRDRIPKDDWPFIYYVDTEPWVGEERSDLLAALRLMICSASPEPIVENCLPVPVDGAANLLRMDIRKLRWEYDDWKNVLLSNPYAPGGFDMVVRADWLLCQLSDEQESDAYFNLLFTSKLRPKTRDEALTLLNVSNDRALMFGMIEGESGVAKQGTRWLENRPSLRGYAWGTRDSLKLTFEKDPLEHPDGSMVHDGEEWIIGLPKQSSNTFTRGALQIYFLANGKGEIVARAPVDLVEDSTNFRGYREIRFPGSCVQCHKTGLNLPTVNEIRRQSEAGVLQFTGSVDAAQQLQAFHLSDLTRDIARNNEDYQAMVSLITGMPSDKASEAFKRAIDRYDANLNLVAAAQEFVRHGYTPEEATAALQAAATGGATGARIIALTRGQEIPRRAWEQQFLQTLSVVSQWSKNQ